MTKRVTGSGLYETLEARGVSRRDFLRFCGTIAAMIGLSEAAIPQIAAAIEQGAKLKPAIWLSQGLCTGCTESMAQSFYPDAGQIVLDILSVNYWETLSAGAGKSVTDAIEKTVVDEKGKFILIVEGSVMQGWNGNALRVGGAPAIDELKRVADAAEVIVAVGSCAVDGGWVMAKNGNGVPNPSNATGVENVVADPSKVINLPTCPVNPEWVVAMVVDFLLVGKAPALDDQRRPTLIFGQTIHDNCPRRGHFENGEFVEQFGTAEELQNFCLYKVGCKGPQTKTQCPVIRWNARTSWCVESGSPCIGCGNFNWVENDAPFLSRTANIPVAGTNVSPQTIGLVVGGVALAGLAVHGVATMASGRMGHGAEVEPAPPAPGEAEPDSAAEAPSEEQKGGDA